MNSKNGTVGNGRMRPDRLARERRRTKVGRLYTEGWNQTEIACKLGVAQSTVSEDLKLVRKRWLELQVSDLEEARAEELEKIRLVVRNAWEGWEQSKRKNGYGNPRYLNLLLSCIDKECKILGLYEHTPDYEKVEKENEISMEVAYEVAKRLEAEREEIEYS